MGKRLESHVAGARASAGPQPGGGERRGIVLLHDTKAQTAAMLPPFLRALKTRGYSIVHTVPAPRPLAASGPE